MNPRRTPSALRGISRCSCLSRTVWRELPEPAFLGVTERLYRAQSPHARTTTRIYRNRRPSRVDSRVRPVCKRKGTVRRSAAYRLRSDRDQSRRTMRHAVGVLVADPVTICRARRSRNELQGGLGKCADSSAVAKLRCHATLNWIRVNNLSIPGDSLAA